MLDRRDMEPARLPPESPPLLLVVIDTEEEFDWNRPLSRSNTAVDSIAAQGLAQEVFARHGVVPTYVVDYPVASSGPAVGRLRSFLEDGRCEIGAHLHPWVNPPHEEEVNARNSYPGNLPPALERAKLARLSDTIEAGFGCRPTVYKAGRYGVGPATAAILADLGYEVDLSVVPGWDYSADGGPNFNGFGPHPYWFGGQGRLLEVPLTCGFAGALAEWGPGLYPRLASAAGMRLRAPGVAARLGLLERIRLTPEGVDHAAHRRLTEALLARGCRVFSLAYHSPSLTPGNTPYVRDRAGLEAFLGTLERYLDYFLGALGGRATTPTALRRLLGSEVS